MKFEEQQKREERQFQLHMMQMLVGSSTHLTDPHVPAPHYHPMYSPFPSNSQYYSRSNELEES